MSEDDVARRREEAREKAAYHAAAAERARAQDVREATATIDAFVAAATERGLRTARFTARPYSGGGRLRTDVEGWYVKRDRSLGVGRDGGWYVLVVPPSLRARLTGVRLEPSEPSTQVGRGARDGESIALDVLLQQRLDAGDDFPE